MKNKTKIICTLCGYKTYKIGSSSGVWLDGDNSFDFYGNHSCPNGEMGTMILESEIAEYKASKANVYNKKKIKYKTNKSFNNLAGGGYIEFKDEENQEKCVKLIDDIVKREREAFINEIKKNLKTSSLTQFSERTPENTYRCERVLHITTLLI